MQEIKQNNALFYFITVSSVIFLQPTGSIPLSKTSLVLYPFSSTENVLLYFITD